MNKWSKLDIFKKQEKDRPAKYVCNCCKDSTGKYLEFDELYVSDIENFDIFKVQDLEDYFKENERKNKNTFLYHLSSYHIKKY